MVSYFLMQSFLSLQSLEYHNWSAVNFKKKQSTSMSCTPEPVVKSCDTGQQMPYFDSCQLIITLIFIICLCLGLKTIK